MNHFAELSLVIALATVAALILKFLRQPPIIAYILTGIAAGPSILNIIHDRNTIETFSHIGIALLLFIIGLDLSMKVFARLGKVVIISTMLQVVIVGICGFSLANLLGFHKFESAIIGLALAMSSTIIIVKLFNDKRETTRLHGQIAIGILILQDIIATGAKIGLATKSDEGSASDVIFLLTRGVVVTVLLFVSSRYLIPRLTKSIEASKELLLLFALSWGLGIATLFDYIGFSIEIGALFAGVSLASLPYSSEMSSRLKPLRDFFIVIFFIALGQSLSPTKLFGEIWVALLFVGIVVFIKPLVTLISMGMMGYTRRTSLKTSIAMSQISEFSLVFMTAAIAAGVASERARTAVTLAALITFAVSTYLIKYDNLIYSKIQNSLRLFERKTTRNDSHSSIHYHPYVLFGYRKGGAEFIKTFQSMNHGFVVVDYDPEVIEIVERQNLNYLYGDATDPELLEELNLDESKLIISTISDAETNLFIAHWLAKNNPQAVFICNADTAHNASELYNEGASYVMMPHYIGSEKIGAFIKRSGLKKSEFRKFRDKHLAYLANHFDDSPLKHQHSRLGHAVLAKMNSLKTKKKTF